MDTGARSATAAGIRLPRYPPRKQTKGGQWPLRLSVRLNSPKVGCYAVSLNCHSTRVGHLYGYLVLELELLVPVLYVLVFRY